MRVEMVSGVFMAIVILLTIHGSSGMPALVPRGMENEKVWEAILYGYVIDPDAPSYLARGDRIFDVTTDDAIAISSNSDMVVEFEYSDSEHTAAKKVASSMSISGSYGAFSGAASMEVSQSSDSSIKTVRMDAMIKAMRYEVASKGGLRTFPERYLTANFKEAVKALTVEQIEKRIGSFYATRMDLGGEIRKSYTMQATKDDTEQSVSAELKAAYQTGLMGASAKASLGVSSRSSNEKAQLNIAWSAKGGDTLVWLGKSFSDSGDTSVSNIQLEWAKTINDDNLYPFNYELGLMWELVKHVDLQKGKDFQQYLENKWEANSNLFNPTRFLAGSPPRRPAGSRSWTKWSNDNFSGESLTNDCPPNHIVVGLQWGEQNGYGLIEVYMDCGYGSEIYFTRNSRGSRNSKKTCSSTSNYGFQVIQGREQNGYGIINTDMQCSGSSSWMRSNDNMSGGWNPVYKCPIGSVVTGMEVREQRGYGIINFRSRCTELVQ